MTTTFQDVPLFPMTGGITPEHIRAIWHIANIPDPVVDTLLEEGL